jgi:acetolactate synthase-1/2/3 large subunit
MNHAGGRRNQSREWVNIPVADNGEAIVAAMTEAGVEFVFFTSGSEIGFYQEAIAKAEAQGRKAPKLISVTHEHANLNAALGCAAVSGKPVATAAHVDCGTQHYGGAVHTAWHAGLPVLITAGIPPTAYPDSMIGAREPEGHLWLQQTFDQNGIVRQYTKWDHLLKFQDNPGLTVSRALQVACTEPRGPVYLSIPREVSLAKANSARFPTLDQLGVGRPAAPEPEGVRELAARLVKADNPIVVVSRSGRNPATVPALVRFCELMGLPVAQSAKRSYQCFPFTHPLYQGSVSLTDADVVLVLDVDIPWMIGTNAPSDDAFVAMVDVEPSKRRIPIMEFTADLRLTADTLLTLEALETEVRAISSAADRERFAARAKRWGETSDKRRRALADNAKAAAGNTPIDVRWLSHQIGQALEDDWLVTIIFNARGRTPISAILPAAADGRRGRHSAPSSRPPIATSSRSPETVSTCSPRRLVRCGRPRNTRPRISPSSTRTAAIRPERFACRAAIRMASLPRPAIPAATSSRRSTLLLKPDQPVLTEKTLRIPKK